jgi:hypothetical protein
MDLLSSTEEQCRRPHNFASFRKDYWGDLSIRKQKRSTGWTGWRATTAQMYRGNQVANEHI